MTDRIFESRALERSRKGPDVTVHTFDSEVLVSTSGVGYASTLHLSADEVLKLVEILSESALLMTTAKQEAA